MDYPLDEKYDVSALASNLPLVVREELWSYNYNGFGEKIIVLAEKPKDFISYYSPDFRINPSEKTWFLSKAISAKTTTTKPLWDFNGQWLSDIELQYEMPAGEKKIYRIVDNK